MKNIYVINIDACLNKLFSMTKEEREDLIERINTTFYDSLDDALNLQSQKNEYSFDISEEMIFWTLEDLFNLTHEEFRAVIEFVESKKDILCVKDCGEVMTEDVVEECEEEWLAEYVKSQVERKDEEEDEEEVAERAKEEYYNDLEWFRAGSSDWFYSLVDAVIRS